MANLTLHVTLVNGYLNVDQSGNKNVMPRGQSGEITWILDGDAATRSFNALDATHPGFAWIPPPNPSPFGPPSRSSNFKEIQLSDNNTNSVSEQTYTYQLYATIGGSEYYTISTLNNPRSVDTNPWIKNK